MPRLPESIANPENAAIVRSNIATDEATQVVWLPFPESDVNEYRALATGSFSFFNISDYIPVFLETGSTYTISARGTVRPEISIVDGEGYTYITIDGDDVTGGLAIDDANEDSIFFFEPDFTGLHYVNMGPQDSQFFGANTDYSVTFTEDINGDLFNLFADQFDIPGDATSDRRASVGVDYQGFLGDGAEGRTASSPSLSNTDIDHVHISLTAGQSYQLVVQSTSLKPYTGIANFQNATVNFDKDNAALFTYTADRTGDHALVLNGSSSGTSDFGAGGTYLVTLTETGDDHPNVIGSNTTVVPGVATTGNLETGGDKDVFKVSGIAGTTYTIDLRGAPSSVGTLTDPLVRVLDSSGSQVARDDDGGTGLESSLAYSPTTTGDFYIEAGAFSSNLTGTYQIDVSATGSSIPTAPDSGAFIPDTEANRAAIREEILSENVSSSPPFGFLINSSSNTSEHTVSFQTRLDSSSDILDLMPIHMIAGNSYGISIGPNASSIFLDEINLGSISNFIDGIRSSLSLHDQNGNTFSVQNQTSTQGFTGSFSPTVSGIYYLRLPVAETLDRTTFNVDLTFTEDVGGDGINSTAQDIGNSFTSTSGINLPVGGRIISDIEQAGDVDVFRLNLAEDTRYCITMMLDERVGYTINDNPVLNNGGEKIKYTVYDDNHSGSPTTNNLELTGFLRDSFSGDEFYFTPDATGTYYLAIESSTSTGTGTYPIIVFEDNDPQRLPINENISGNIHEAFFYRGGSEGSDTYNIQLTAGAVYEFEVKGAPSNNGTLLDPQITIGTSFPKLLFSDNTAPGRMFFSSTGDDAKLTFIPDETKDYRILVSGNGHQTKNQGSYTISVKTISDPSEAITFDGVYRFFNTETGTHFYSASLDERNTIMTDLPSFNLEGPAFRAADSANGPTASVFRFFNTETGTHFFTQSTAERDSITANLPSFNLEGEAYLGYTEEVAGSTPLYRFFNTDTGTHFYTAAEVEKDSIIENLPSFNFEGTAYWVDPVMG